MKTGLLGRREEIFQTIKLAIVWIHSWQKPKPSQGWLIPSGTKMIQMDYCSQNTLKSKEQKTKTIARLRAFKILFMINCNVKCSCFIDYHGLGRNTVPDGQGTLQHKTQWYITSWQFYQMQQVKYPEQASCCKTIKNPL